MPLSGRAILITGAGGGLGGTAALALAKQGARVILLDKSIAKLEATYDHIVAEGGVEPMLYPFDLAGASEEQYLELAEAVCRHYGSLQGLLHSAVEFTAYMPIAGLSVRDWQHGLTVNLHAAFLLSKVLLPVLQKSQRAAIVFTSDSASRRPHAYAGAYGVSKIALEGFAKILAEELTAGRKIRVNTIVPGPIDSPVRQKGYPAEDKSKLAVMSILGPVYCYLFGDASLGVTGQIIDAQTFKL